MLEKFLGKCLIFDNGLFLLFLLLYNLIFLVKNSGAFDEQAFIKLYKEDNVIPLVNFL